MADEVGDLSPPDNGSLKLIMIGSYSENKYLADEVADLPPSADLALDLPGISSHSRNL